MWRSVETHPDDRLWRLIITLQAFNTLPVPLRDFIRFAIRRPNKLMKIGEYNEMQTKWLLLFIERGVLEAYYAVRPL
jgi:hypothetical protein